MTQLNDLDDDCLLEVLDRLPPDQLFKMQGVNRRLNGLAGDKTRVKIKTVAIKGLNRLSNCSHFNTISPDQMLLLGKEFKNLWKPSTKTLFLSVLAKCAGVKSLYFGNLKSQKFPGDFLLEVVRRCPELECIKLVDSHVREEDWALFLDQIGHKIVHFGWSRVDGMANDTLVQSVSRSDARLIELVALKCDNIRRVTVNFDWHSVWSLTSDLMEALKLLPKSCWIALHCDFINSEYSVDLVEDNFDELDIFSLTWTAIGHRLDRLSSLKSKFLRLNRFANPGVEVRGVHFAELKTLEFSEALFNNESVNCLAASRFPQLEEFGFNSSSGLTEVDFESLFQRMETVKKLTIFCGLFEKLEYVQCFPRSSIHRLKNLEIINLNIRFVPSNWQPKDFVRQLEQYIDGIGTLKKIIVKDTERRLWGDELKKTFEDKVLELKVKQKRVEIEMMFEN